MSNIIADLLAAKAECDKLGNPRPAAVVTSYSNVAQLRHEFRDVIEHQLNPPSTILGLALVQYAPAENHPVITFDEVNKAYEFVRWADGMLKKFPRLPWAFLCAYYPLKEELRVEPS